MDIWNADYQRKMKPEVLQPLITITWFRSALVVAEQSKKHRVWEPIFIMEIL
jgi:hypothetical protein